MMAIDPDLIRALHLTTEDHDGATRDTAAAHHVFQTSTVQALLDSRYEGDLTIAELLAHGDLGLGTLDSLDGELIVADGAAYVARVDGSVVAVDGTARTPFAVVTPFAPGPPTPVCGLDNAALLAEMDRQCPTTVAAVRVRGYFTRLRVRSVPKQQPPYPPLDRVVNDQVEWEIGPVDAVLVGFRFPTVAAGMEVPGWHLHALADAVEADGARQCGQGETARRRPTPVALPKCLYGNKTHAWRSPRDVEGTLVHKDCARCGVRKATDGRTVVSYDYALNQ